MNALNCEYVRDVLPELSSGRLDTGMAAGVLAHLEGCAECRFEQRIGEIVSQARLEVPAGLEQRVRLATAGRRGGSGWNRARMAAAATVAVAIIGGSALLAPYLERSAPDQAVAVSSDPEAGAGFFGVEDAFNSGASSLKDLTEEELKQLLVELDS